MPTFYKLIDTKSIKISKREFLHGGVQTFL